jgi:hypothetical protein
MSRPKYKQLYLASVELQRKQDAKVNKLENKLIEITKVLSPYGEEFLRQHRNGEPIYCRALEYLAVTIFIEGNARYSEDEPQGFVSYAWAGQPIYKVHHD